MEREDYVAAEVLFREALERSPDDRTRLQLAAALEGQGRVSEAYLLARAVQEGDDLLLGDAAREAASRLEDEVAWIVPDADQIVPSPDQLLVGEHPAQAGVAVPVDPGSVAVRAVRRGQVVAVKRISVSRGQRARVSLDPEAPDPPDDVASTGATLEAPTPRETAMAAAPSDGEPPSTPAKRSRRGLGIGLGVAGAVLVGVAVVLAIALGGGTAEPTQGDLEPVHLMEPSMGSTP